MGENNPMEVKILVVDDEVLIADVIGDIASGHQFQMVHAGNGSVALDILKSENFSLLITDLDMPQLDGETLIEKVRTEQNRIPIIVYSAQVDREGMEAKLLARGASEVLRKPQSISQLEEAILRHVSNSLSCS